jgi:hypothetical protein
MVDNIRQRAKDILEEQIIQDANEGDTTVLAEIIRNMTDEEIIGSLSDKNQEILKKLARE